jgi:hypothetical protein
MPRRRLASMILAALPLALGAGCRTQLAGPGGPEEAPFQNQLDLLFVVDDGSAAAAQAKLGAQIPTFIQMLEALPRGLPDLHVAVITTDMGAPGDEPRCSATGDAGLFQSTPGAAASCASGPLPAGASFLSRNGAGQNFTGDLATALQCLILRGAAGCGFKQPLAAIARALGADGSPPPAANAGFLRPDALLGIIILTTEDDCSAPPGTALFGLQTGQSSLAEPLGPLAPYRCNRYGHLCRDAGGAQVAPPLAVPAGLSGTPPIESFSDCVSNETGTGMLLSVSSLAAMVRGLKASPDDQIAVSAIVAPAAPYAVEWLPASSSANAPGELWPQVMHACGAAGGDGVNPLPAGTTTDGTFGDPAVRITEFARRFRNDTLRSICDASYRDAMTPILSAF